MSMKDTIQDALDDINSPSASSGRRSRALAVLEQQLALACASNVQDDTMRHFLELQDTFQCNVPSRTFSWIQTAVSRVETLAGKTSSDKERETELNVTCSQLYQLLSVIQGIALHHTGSKEYLGRRYPLEILVALLTTSRHTSMITPAPVNGLSSDKTWSTAHLSSAVLDTLLCVLVDSSTALRMFEDVNGVQAVVRLLKRAGTPREVRMKCLEFLYFYLMDETAHDANGVGWTGSQTMPSTPVTTQVYGSVGPKIFPRASSGVSSLSMGWSSSSSTSTKSGFSATSQKRTPSPVKKSYSTPGYMPDMHTPPNSPPGGRSTPRVVSIRPRMTMFDDEVDYEPQSPRKSVVRAMEEDGQRERVVLTTEEKKEKLGRLLGNVDALVEGVRKAGIWGLT